MRESIKETTGDGRKIDQVSLMAVELFLLF